MKRIAFIDLGSNSVRFIVIDNNDDGSHQMIYQEKETIRLSQGMWEHQKLTQAAMDRAIKALQGFAHMADVMEVDSVYAVATAAVRLAHNQKEFINRVEKETGFVLHCISGQEEARLGFLGIINTLSLSDFVSFDLGGASTEVSLVRNRQLVQSVSLPVGAVTLSGRFPTDGVVDAKILSRMMAHIETIVEDYPWLKDVRLPLVGIGGTARNLAKMERIITLLIRFIITLYRGIGLRSFFIWSGPRLSINVGKFPASLQTERILSWRVRSLLKASCAFLRPNAYW